MMYELLELSGKDPETVVQTLASSYDREELEAVRDAL